MSNRTFKYRRQVFIVHSIRKMIKSEKRFWRKVHKLISKIRLGIIKNTPKIINKKEKLKEEQIRLDKEWKDFKDKWW